MPKGSLAREASRLLRQILLLVDPWSLNASLDRSVLVWCEQAEAEAAGGKPLNIGEYATATNTLRRLLLDLGLERRMRDITPNIDAYLKRG